MLPCTISSSSALTPVGGHILAFLEKSVVVRVGQDTRIWSESEEKVVHVPEGHLVRVAYSDVKVARPFEDPHKHQSKGPQ